MMLILIFDFNPDVVKEYRLIGFDNKLGALSDTSSVIQGGEIGSGHSLVAMFEFKASMTNVDDLHPGKKGYAKLHLHYKLPGDSISRQDAYDCPFVVTSLEDLPAPYRFASSTVMFRSLLRKSKLMQQVNWDIP